MNPLNDEPRTITARPHDLTADFLSQIPSRATPKDAASIQAAPVPTPTDPDLPACPLCRAPAFAGYAFGRYDDLAHDCDCVANEPTAYFVGLRKLYRQKAALPEFLASLPPRFRTARVKDFIGTAAAAYALSLGTLPTTAFIFGPTGVGKTRLAAAVGAAAAVQGMTIRYTSATDYVQAMRAASAPGGPARPDLLSPEGLILDDLAKMKPGDFAYEVLFTLIEARWAAEKMTLFTSNHDPAATALALLPRGTFPAAADQQAAVAALASRLGSGYRIEMTGPDQRAAGK